MSDFFNNPAFGIGVTLVVYVSAQLLYQRTRKIFLNPVAVAVIVLITLLELGHIPYASYRVGGDMILFLLGPAVVALGVPLYEQRSEILKRKLPIIAGVAAGAVASIVSASGLAWLLGGSREVVLSLAPKSVTTPIAIGIAEKIGGIAPLTAALVVVTGCLGGMCGPEFCRWIGVRQAVARGLAVGTASHGIGTARMLEIDHLAGATSGLAIGLNGLITAFVLPLMLLFV